jgi:hypothetical protein
MDIRPSGPLRILVRFLVAQADFLWIEANAADVWFTIPSSPLQVRVRFPPVNPGETGRPDWFPFTATRDNRSEAYGVLVLESQVDIPATISQWDTKAQIAGALAHTRSVVTHLLEWCKIRQPWIGPFETPPPLLDNPDIMEIETGETRSLELRTPPRLESGSVRSMDHSNLSSEAIAKLATQAGIGERPDAASAFLADAYYAVFCDLPRDLKRGVLLAAFACEVRLRDEFRAHLLPEAEPLYERGYPDLSVRGKKKPGVSTWPGPVAKELVGRSLEEEDVHMYWRFRRLIDLRNDLSHRGKEPTLEDALEGVRTARRIFAWLDSWART